ncbi:hypothetical protein Clacol_008101 [Clathrus columnatus]|uniref:Peptidase M1 leukotriene A4 hydrolase/aminopeptidase C-terminal domain-containing protein n=1 Tax=Clathrus columnatus TaxID=1419009 RepID=A0AAV5AGT4_9AGAM|nr:hypothetical protein Clacol_008101 [Clathrus columnatus]
MTSSLEIDLTTQANYLDISTTHVDFTWDLDFKAKIITGSAKYSLLAKKDVTEVVLDTLGLNITNVQVDGEQASASSNAFLRGLPVYTLGKEHPVMGSSLSIPLSKTVSSGKTTSIKIDYSTSANSLGKRSERNILTSLVNVSPFMRVACYPFKTYSASVTSVLPVVLSAIRQSPPSTGPAHDGKEIGKEKPIPIPSYLIAIAAGDLRYRSFTVKDRNWTSGVWAEPEVIDSAYEEFNEDTVTYLAAAEDTLTPYRFSVYDLLVLPPAFPYGGMENACLTFLTPTVMAGDRSLNDVIIHELSHSWFGNGVTHATASSFFLNEGWTTYTERYLLEKIKGPHHRDFSFIIGYKGLVDDLKRYEDKPKYQRLIIDFEKGENPDDAYSQVPYDKGKRTLGGIDVLIPYMRDYINTFTGKSITATQWKDHLYDYFRKSDQEKVKLLDTIDWQAWFYGEGITLPVDMPYDTTLVEQAYALATSWDSSRDLIVSELTFKADDLKDFNGNQTIVFLERLESYKPLPKTHVHHLGKVYSLNTSSNAEIRLRWYVVALSSDAGKDFVNDAANWLVNDEKGLKGRMKFCRPTFRAIYQIDKELAQKTFLDHASEFHPITANLVKKVGSIVNQNCRRIEAFIGYRLGINGENIPVEQFGSVLSRRILDSLKVDGDNDPACAEAARLWEDALEIHPNAAYLLLKVADMRLALDSSIMATILYEQLQSVYKDPAYITWSFNLKNAVIGKARQHRKYFLGLVYAYKTSQEYVGSRRWVSAKENYSEFPSTATQVANEALQSLHQQWRSLIQQDNDVLKKFMNIHCIETNVLESTMIFNPSSTTKLIQVGFYNQALGISDSDVIGGATLKEIFSLSEERTILTIDLLCRLHRTMMRSSRVLCINGQRGRYLKYVAIGELMRTPDIDPFAAAAWINHVFVAVHPFELRQMRRSADYSELMTYFFDETLASIEYLATLPAQIE